MDRQYLNPSGLWDAQPRGYSHVVQVSSPGSLIFVAGQAAVNADLQIVADDIEEQTRAIFGNLRRALKPAGATLDDIVAMTIYLRDINHQWVVRKVRSEFFSNERLPVSTMVEVSRFSLDSMLIEITVIATR
jgi:enamine deaminase RidA (YjgF/YER057c/UK114 family)